MLFNEPKLLKSRVLDRGKVEPRGFSALQRAEIAEIDSAGVQRWIRVSSFSALQRAEIAEIRPSRRARTAAAGAFQCSSTSRNC